MSRVEFNASRRQTLLRLHPSSPSKHVHTHLHGQTEHIRECRGYNEIPKVFIEQSHKMKNTKKILHKILVEEQQKRDEQHSQGQSRSRAGQGDRPSSASGNNTSAMAGESQRGDQHPEEQQPPLQRLKQWLRLAQPKLLQQLATAREEKDQADPANRPAERRQSSLNNINQLHMKMMESQHLQNESCTSESDDEPEELEDEEDQQMNELQIRQSCLVLQPDSPIRATWDITLFFMIIYQAIVLPMRISFEMKFNEFLFYFEIVIDCMFMFDIVLNFNTGIYLKGKLEMSRRVIA